MEDQDTAVWMMNYSNPRIGVWASSTPYGSSQALATDRHMRSFTTRVRKDAAATLFKAGLQMGRLPPFPVRPEIGTPGLL